MITTKPNNGLKKLTKVDFQEDRFLLRIAEEASKSLAILDYELRKIPNKQIFIDTLYVQEAKQSNNLESYVTTDDEIYRTLARVEETRNAKWVEKYTDSIRRGEKILQDKPMINRDNIVELHSLLEVSASGIRKNSTRIESSYTRIRNNVTGEIIYTPPHGEAVLNDLIDDALEFVYNDDMYFQHPLVKIAMVHYQFEKIHPFKDGNGRIGRIINLLLLVQKKYICLPILYGSEYINKNKDEYYRYLQEVGEDDDFTGFVTFMLISFNKAADKTLRIINEIREKIEVYTSKKELVNFKGQMNMLKAVVDRVFQKVYFTTEDFHNLHYYSSKEQKYIGISINKDSITKYTKMLEERGLITSEIIPNKRGNPKLYKNIELLKILEEENNRD